MMNISKNTLAVLLLLMVMISGCQLLEDIFAAGFWVGLIVAIIIIIVIFIIVKFFKGMSK